VANVDEQRQRAEEEFSVQVADALIDDAVHVIVDSLSSASTTWLRDVAILLLSHHDRSRSSSSSSHPSESSCDVCMRNAVKNAALQTENDSIN
jgi:hypothetical protein